MPLSPQEQIEIYAQIAALRLMVEKLFTAHLQSTPGDPIEILRMLRNDWMDKLAKQHAPGLDAATSDVYLSEATAQIRQSLDRIEVMLRNDQP